MKDEERAVGATTKGQLDTKIAALLDMPISDVSMITSLFLRLLSIHIARQDAVHLPNFGWFHRNRSRVFFHKSKLLGRLLRETKMEKLGVDEGMDQESMEKAAAQDCPECGAKVERHGRILACPNCGTAPFEKSSSK